MFFLLFQLGSDRYALPARDVLEVLPLVAWKELPGAPPGVIGLIDYRGATAPLIDLSELTLGRRSARRVSTRVFLVDCPLPDGGVRRIGLVAERATDLLVKAPEEFEPTGVRTQTTRFLGPVARDARGLVQRVEIAGLLGDGLREALFAGRPVEKGGGP